MIETQHHFTVRVPITNEAGKQTSQIVTVHCPPHCAEALLDGWLLDYRRANPNAQIVSRSWKSNA